MLGYNDFVLRTVNLTRKLGVGTLLSTGTTWPWDSKSTLTGNDTKILVPVFFVRKRDTHSIEQLEYLLASMLVFCKSQSQIMFLVKSVKFSALRYAVSA